MDVTKTAIGQFTYILYIVSKIQLLIFVLKLFIIFIDKND